LDNSIIVSNTQQPFCHVSSAALIKVPSSDYRSFLIIVRK